MSIQILGSLSGAMSPRFSKGLPGMPEAVNQPFEAADKPPQIKRAEPETAAITLFLLVFHI
jgi:hypothetical protein